MFEGCTYLKTATLNNVGNGIAGNMAQMFGHCQQLTSTTFTNVGRGLYADFTYMFFEALGDANKLTKGTNASLTFTGVGTGRAHFGCMFMRFGQGGRSNLNSLKLDWEEATTDTINGKT